MNYAPAFGKRLRFFGAATYFNYKINILGHGIRFFGARLKHTGNHLCLVFHQKNYSCRTPLLTEVCATSVIHLARFKAQNEPRYGAVEQQVDVES